MNFGAGLLLNGELGLIRSSTSGLPSEKTGETEDRSSEVTEEPEYEAE